jgi:hypothetical protein
MTSLEESGVLATRLLENWDLACASAAAVRPSPPRGTWEEERRDVLEAVLEELREEEPGPDRLATCRRLLQNLAFGPSTSS